MVGRRETHPHITRAHTGYLFACPTCWVTAVGEWRSAHARRHSSRRSCESLRLGPAHVIASTAANDEDAALLPLVRVAQKVPIHDRVCLAIVCNL